MKEILPMIPGELVSEYRTRLALEQVHADDRRRAELSELTATTTAPDASESEATYQGSAAMPRCDRAAASTADRLFDRRRAVTGTVLVSPFGERTRQTSLPCTLL